MENEKTLEELKQQTMQQYGLTEEQLDNLRAACSKLWEVVKEFLNRAASAFQELAEAISAAAQRIEREHVQEHVESSCGDTCADALAAALEQLRRIQDEIASLYISTPPTYDRTDTRNGYYSAKLKSYKNRICSAAIRKPRGVARSCC